MRRTSDRWVDLLGLATLVFMLLGLYMAFMYAQTEITMGLVYRIFFSISARLRREWSPSSSWASLRLVTCAPAHAWNRVVAD